MPGTRCGGWGVTVDGAQPLVAGDRPEQAVGRRRPARPNPVATLVRDLAAHVDVVIENFKPGTLDRWGIGPCDAQRREPRPRAGPRLRVRPDRSARARARLRRDRRGDGWDPSHDRRRRPPAGAGRHLARGRARRALRGDRHPDRGARAAVVGTRSGGGRRDLRGGARAHGVDGRRLRARRCRARPQRRCAARRRAVERVPDRRRPGRRDRRQRRRGLRATRASRWTAPTWPSRTHRTPSACRGSGRARRRGRGLDRDAARRPRSSLGSSGTRSRPGSSTPRPISRPTIISRHAT